MAEIDSHNGSAAQRWRWRQGHQVSFYFNPLSNVLPEKEAGHKEIGIPFERCLNPWRCHSQLQLQGLF